MYIVCEYKVTRVSTKYGAPASSWYVRCEQPNLQTMNVQAWCITASYDRFRAIKAIRVFTCDVKEPGFLTYSTRTIHKQCWPGAALPCCERRFLDGTHVARPVYITRCQEHINKGNTNLILIWAWSDLCTWRLNQAVVPFICIIDMRGTFTMSVVWCPERVCDLNHWWSTHDICQAYNGSGWTF